MNKSTCKSPGTWRVNVYNLFCWRPPEKKFEEHWPDDKHKTCKDVRQIEMINLQDAEIQTFLLKLE